jgi:hypothetical protein
MEANGQSQRIDSAGGTCMVRSFVVLVWVLLLALPAPVPAAARPADPASPTIVRHAPATGAVDCATIWASGFPRDGTGLTYCLEHARETIGGAEYRVLYPSEWSTEVGWGEPYLNAATQTIRDSISVYGKLGLVSSANVVFSPKLVAGAETSYADANLVKYLSEEPCAIVIYPLASAAPEAEFKQMLAHELFHCFQNWNFPEQSQVAYSASGWWKDGAADYFSNVVYPATNNEWSRIGIFDSTSETTPLTRMTYEASFFFQHLGNSIGDAAIIDLIGSMPASGGEAEQRVALRAWPGMDNLFQEFAEDYLAGTLTDTGGASIPFSPVYTVTARFNASGSFNAEIEPFVIRRRMIEFAPSMSFTLQIEETSGASQNAFRIEGGAWGTMPAAISCEDPRTWNSVFTSLGEEASSTPAVVTVTVDASEECDEPETDSCLLGAWQVLDYEAFMVAALGLAGADTSAVPVTFEGAGGSMAFTFDASTITYTASEFELRGSAVTQGIAIQVVIRISGTATASYEVAEKGVIDIVEVDASGFTITAESFVGGGSAGVMPMEPLDWIFFASDTYGYTCSKTSLQLTIPPLAVPVVLQR